MKYQVWREEWKEADDCGPGHTWSLLPESSLKQLSQELIDDLGIMLMEFEADSWEDAKAVYETYMEGYL